MPLTQRLPRRLSYKSVLACILLSFHYRFIPLISAVVFSVVDSSKSVWQFIEQSF